jgi:hypothetical protein
MIPDSFLRDWKSFQRKRSGCSHERSRWIHEYSNELFVGFVRTRRSKDPRGSLFEKNPLLKRFTIKENHGLHWHHQTANRSQMWLWFVQKIHISIPYPVYERQKEDPRGSLIGKDPLLKEFPWKKSSKWYCQTDEQLKLTLNVGESYFCGIDFV